MESLDRTPLDDDHNPAGSVVQQPAAPVQVEKPKRILTDAQKAALQAGREARQQKIQAKRQPEPVPEPVSVQRLEKPRMSCPVCNVEIAKSSLRNHMNRFHTQPTPPQPQEHVALPARIEVNQPQPIIQQKQAPVLPRPIFI